MRGVSLPVPDVLGGQVLALKDEEVLRAVALGPFGESEGPRDDDRRVDFAGAPMIPAAVLRTLAEGESLRRAEPVLFLGEPGTGKTHLATGLGVAACRQRRRVPFTTAAALVNDRVEAQHHHQLSRVTNRWAHCELVVIDELGYGALAEVGAELLFQLIAERAEKAAVIATTNLPFSE